MQLAIRPLIHFFLLLFALIAWSNCVTTDDNGKEIAPPITDELSTEEAMEIAIESGGDRLLATKELLQKRKEWLTAAAWLRKQIAANLLSWSDHRLIHALNLYQACSDPRSAETFLTLVNSKRELAHRLAWLLASSQASEGMRLAIDSTLSSLVSNNLLDLHLIPQLALAIQSNRLTSSYTVLREGLIEKGDPEFARAMIELAPEKASEDFLDYLAQAQFEDLRQITILKVNIMSATIIFEHFMTYPPSIAHHNFEAVFNYTVSRNRPLAEMAEGLMSQYMPSQTRTLALILSQMDSPVQLAVVESVRRNMTAELRVFLDELRTMTAKNEVIEEINSLF